MKHLLIIIAQKRKLETILGRIERDCPGTSGTVEAVNCLAFDAREVDRIIQGADDTVVTVQSTLAQLWSGSRQCSPLREAVFYMIQRRVDEDASIVPRARLDTNCLMDETMLREIPVGDGDR
jgi:hypothetical protein